MNRPPALIAAALLLLTAGRAPAQPELEARVRTALQSCELAPESRVSIEARGGVVTLGGHVRTLHERECIAIEAEKVSGVSFLYPRTVVRPARPVDEALLVERARAALRDQAGLAGPAPLTVSASKGRVVLAGQVRVPEDKYRAEAALRRVEGITELENHVSVDPQQGLRSLEVQLQELFRVREIPVEGLRFYEAEGRVVIEGRSHDVVAREVVEEFLRDLPGGKLIVDRLQLVLRPADEPAEG